MSPDEAKQYCEQLCQAAISDLMDMCLGMCVNAGQEAIIGNAEGQISDACMSCADGGGGSSGISPGHEDAVGIITDAASDFLDSLATRCQQIMENAEQGLDGDGSPYDGDGDDDGMGGEGDPGEEGD
jgi:hypothetical protein